MDPIAYLEHLTDSDIQILVDVSRTGDVPGLHEFLEESWSRLPKLLASDPMYDAIFGANQEEALLRGSPFLVFAVLISRAHADLKEAPFVEEWMGPAMRIPVFDVGGLRRFSADIGHQLFLTEVLASFTRVSSGSYWVHSPRGWQRHRYSELDIMRLIEMLEVVPDYQRPQVLRWLGDLTLFLTGVFPDFAGNSLFRSSSRRRLQSAVMAPDQQVRDQEELAVMEFLELIGSASYRMASNAAADGGSEELRDIAGGFGQARRVLNYVTDQYLFAMRGNWFGLGQG
jgi:hypothetical protein